jgi:hypothetical protein
VPRARRAFHESRHNVAYFRLQEKNADVETIRVSDRSTWTWLRTVPCTESNYSTRTNSCKRVTWRPRRDQRGLGPATTDFFNVVAQEIE